MTLKEWLDSERKSPRGKVRPARGTQEWLAAKLGCQQSLVSKWVRRVTTPGRYGATIAHLSKGKVTVEELLSERDWAKALVGRAVVVIGDENEGPRTVARVSIDDPAVVELSAPIAGMYFWHSTELRT